MIVSKPLNANTQPSSPTESVASQENTPNQANKSPRVRFDDFPLPPSEDDSARSLAQGDTYVRTFRSAALGALLPIAAAEGIVRPLPVFVPFRPPTPPHPSQTRNSLDIARLFHRGDICEHRARRFSSNQEVEILLEQLGGVSTDGAAEMLEKEDFCWKCKVRRKFENASKLWCCHSGLGDEGRDATRSEMREVLDNV